MIFEVMKTNPYNLLLVISKLLSNFVTPEFSMKPYKIITPSVREYM